MAATGRPQLPPVPRASDYTWIFTAGDIDETNSDAFEGELDKIVVGESDVVVVLHRGAYVGSSALRVVLRCARRLAEAEHELVLVVPDAHVRRVLEVTCLDRVLRVVPTVRDVFAVATSSRL